MADKSPRLTAARVTSLRQEDVWPALWPEDEPELIPGDACAMLVPREQQSADPATGAATTSPTPARKEWTHGSNAQSESNRVRGALVAPAASVKPRARSTYLIDAKGGRTGSRRGHPGTPGLTRGAQACHPRPLARPVPTRAVPLPRRPPVSQPDETTGARRAMTAPSHPVRVRGPGRRIGVVRARSCVRRPGGLLRTGSGARSGRPTSEPAFARISGPGSAVRRAQGTASRSAVIDSGVRHLGSSRWLPGVDVEADRRWLDPEAPDDLPTLVAGLIGGSRGRGPDAAARDRAGARDRLGQGLRRRRRG